MLTYLLLQKLEANISPVINVKTCLPVIVLVITVRRLRNAIICSVGSRHQLYCTLNRTGKHIDRRTDEHRSPPTFIGGTLTNRILKRPC